VQNYIHRYTFLVALNKGIRTPVQMFSWMPGGGRAGEAVHILWRIPPSLPDRDDNKAFQLQAECLAGVSTYHTRVKTAIFFATVVHPSFIDSKAAACAMYRHLTGDHLPLERCKEKKSAIIVAEMALASQDFSIIQDLRELNGTPNNPSFDIFWSEIKTLLELHARVDDRRHGKIIVDACTSRITLVYDLCLTTLCICMYLQVMHATYRLQYPFETYVSKLWRD